MTEQWADALVGFDATHYCNRLGIQRARADDPADVRSALREAGADTIAWYGVRLFSDHWIAMHNSTTSRPSSKLSWRQADGTPTAP